MIEVKKILEATGGEFKLLDEEGNCKIYKDGSKRNLLIMESKDDQFLLSRDWFEYLDFNSLPYSFLLINKTKEKMYYLDFSKGHNWVKSCFETCEKDDIYLGKQVLNSQITLDELIVKMKK